MYFNETLCFVQAITEENVHWNEEIGEWQLKCVAYTGNNMRKVITSILIY